VLTVNQLRELARERIKDAEALFTSKRYEDILIKLEERGQTVPNYAMDRIFDYLMSSNCISGPQFIDRDGIKQQGAMVITFVDRECHVPELSE
jgi:hypothetical protein